MAVNYSILTDVELNLKDVQKKLNEHKFKLNIDSQGIGEAKHDVENLGKAATKASDGVEQLNASGAEVYLTYQAANAILRESIDIISSMVEQVYELDGAVTEFKKVSTLSGKSLDDYIGKLNVMGKQVARTGSEMVEASTEFKKSGFNEEDAANLALVATRYQNVADDAISAGEASNFIISQLKAFNLEASEASHVVDSLNEV